MNQFDSNVQMVMEFLDSEGYGNPAKSINRVCYREFRNYLLQTNCSYSKEKGEEWQELHANDWPKWRVKENRICLRRLYDVYENGYAEKYHPYEFPTWYSQLSDKFSYFINDYMKSFPSKDGRYCSTVKMECSDFLMFVQDRGKQNLTEITIEDIFLYMKEGYGSRSESTHRLFINQARNFMHLQANKGRIKRYLPLSMNILYYKQIIFMENLSDHDKIQIEGYRQESEDFPANEVWDAITDYMEILETHQYSKTIKKYSLRVLTLFFIFLDMNDLGYTPDIAQIWFLYEKPLLLSNWKMGRKTLSQFEEYVLDGDIYAKGANIYEPRRIDFLPEWCRLPLEAFLRLKEREGMKKSTVDMYRSSNVKFLEFLVKKEVNALNQINGKLLSKFNFQDKHNTLDGKNAYNVRIRNFLIYLEEEGIIKNPLLHKALLCQFAPREKVVITLNEHEVESADYFRKEVSEPYDLRHAAIAALGLKMGLRASDIVNLCLVDIDWKKTTIHLIQEKTQTEELLPMPIDVGNALFKYITKGRPSSKSSYIFIHHRVPYDKLHPSACRKALSKAIPGRTTVGNGFHVTRKTFATKLLRDGIEPGIISETLGHRSKDSVHRYLSLDVERMHLCPLSFEEACLSQTGGDPWC